VITRRRDWVRLGSLFPLVLLAGIGRGRLELDVENLALKSVGTETDHAADVREREFGNDPVLLLLASPRAPDVLSSIDEVELDRWVDELRARPEVEALTDTPTEHPGEHGLAVAIRVGPDGRYADAVGSLTDAARASAPPTYRLAVAGVPAVELAIASEMSAEEARLLPTIVVALALVLLAVYRSPVLALAGVSAPLAGVLLLEGLQGFLGLARDPVSSLLGPSVLTVGVASSVHVIERYRAALRREASAVAASQRAVRELRLPLLLTVLTTVAGFLGLLASPIPAVNRFGLLASVGIVLVVLLALLWLPSLLRLLHEPGRARGARAPGRPLRHPLLLRRWSAALIAASALVAALGAWLATSNRVDGDPLHVLSPGHRARRDAQWVARRLGGSEVFELLLPPGGPEEPASVLGLSADVSALDGVAGPARPPRSSEGGYRLASFLLAPGGSSPREELFARAEAIAASRGWPGAAATGLSVRVARDSNALVHGQRRGIALTLGALWLVMAIGFRSVRLGLLGLVPNVLPLVLIQGAMSALDLPLSVSSSMIGAVMLGLVVDDTIHLLHAWREATGSVLGRVSRTLAAVRRPIAVTTLVLCIGFSVTLLGELGATREFGALAVATLVIALAADLVLLPSLLLWERPRRLGLRPARTTCLEQPSTTS